MSKITVGDVTLYCEVHGDGEPLVLIMGLGGDITRWFRTLPLLAREYRVTAFDNRGAGRSDKPDVPYSMEMMADDIAGLLDALDIPTTHVFGVSMGGMIAQHFALRHPERTISLMLGCTRCGGPHSIPDDSGAASMLNPDLVDVMTAEERARALLPFLWSQEFIDASPAIVEEHIRVTSQYPMDPDAYTRQMAAADAHDTWERLPEITAPTLVIGGDADRLIPAENSRILASRIPGAELVMMPGLGHGFYSEANEEVCRILIDFMKRHGRK